MKSIRRMLLPAVFVLINLSLSFVYAEAVLDVDEERCFTDTDFGEALANGRCWVVVDDVIYDLTNNNWWVDGSHLGHNCGCVTSRTELRIEGTRFNDFVDYYDVDRSSLSKVGALGKARSVAKPAGCGDSGCGSGEDFRNCPQDCPPEMKDGLCVPFFDFVCDPDCGRRYDGECICNRDGFCETEFENHSNCPTDCPPDYPDGLCYGRGDGFCDPDCSLEEDPDCRTTSSTTVSTVVTTPEPECGNGLCDEGENYFNCLRDCPSGGSDGFCDGVLDEVCDPDCRAGGDPDCPVATTGPVEECGNGVCSLGENHENCPQDCPPKTDKTSGRGIIDYMPHTAVLFIAAIILFLAHRKLGEKRIEREREEFRRWKMEHER